MQHAVTQRLPFFVERHLTIADGVEQAVHGEGDKRPARGAVLWKRA
jgi:hypothetical protein